MVNNFSTYIAVISLYQNMGLSNCLLGMGNLTGYVHVPVKYQSFWKRISMKKIQFLIFVLLVVIEIRQIQ